MSPASKIFPDILKRCLSASAAHMKKTVTKNLKGKSTSSQHWLSRQLTDPYVEKAKMMNYRCRSAFKLLEIDEKYQILQPGYTVIDCGAAPGSWTQIAVTKVNANSCIDGSPKGTVIAVDKQQIYPINGAIILGNSDFTTKETQERLRIMLDGNKADAVISDMAPSATGIRDMDNENILNLCYAVLRFAVQISNVNASLVVKLWQCGETNKLKDDIEIFYKNVRTLKPTSSRSDSAEIFLLAREFKGLKTSGRGLKADPAPI